MSLQEIYTNQVNNHRISMGTGGSIGGVTKERDPRLQQLENTVNSAMNQAIQQKIPEQQPEPKVEIQSVGLAQALQELMDTKT